MCPVNLYFAIWPLFHSCKIHELMTADEVMGIFHTTPDSVPDYEIVSIRYSINDIQENGTRQMYVDTINQNIKLTLNPTEGYLASEDTPLWTVKSDKQAPEGLQYTLVPKALKDIGTPMQDERSGAAILVSSESEQFPTFNGFIPTDLVLRSLPQRIGHPLYDKNRCHFNKTGHAMMEMENLMRTYPHIIYNKYRIIPRQDYKSFKITNPLTNIYPIPDVIYPEVLVVIDYDLYSKLGKNIDTAKTYIVAFWNEVDLRYRVLTKPKIRLNIAGIIIETDLGAISYITNSRMPNNSVDADGVLNDMQTYFYKEKRFPCKIYDMAITMTNLNLCSKKKKGECNIFGYSYVEGACNRNITTKTSAAVGVAEDHGGFSGTIIVAHELGHLLGVHHDNTTAKDSETCFPSEDGIMAGTLKLSENQFRWSNCSVNALHKFIGSCNARCLYDKPPKANAIRRLMPGKLMSLDDQCKIRQGGIACEPNKSEVCYKLKCKGPERNSSCEAIAAAAEGSSCGTNLICVDGQCVLEGTEVKDERKYVANERNDVAKWSNNMLTVQVESNVKVDDF